MRTAFRLPAQRVATLAAAISSTLAATHAAQAQQLEEIIVTAERRELNLQDTPISVMSFDGEGLELRGIDDMFELATIAPNLDIKGSRGTGNTSPTFQIRGISGGGGATGGSVIEQGEAEVMVAGGIPDILIANEVVRMIWGNQSLMLNPPAGLTGPVTLPGGMQYASYRLLIIGVGAAVAVCLYLLVTRTRMGMLVRAGASNREMAVAMGVNIRRLFTIVFALGAALCALAGAMLGPILAVQVGMGENILILAFVVIVIGGIGSIRGAFVGALLVGLVDTMGRALLPILFYTLFPPMVASNLGPSLSSIMIYVLMAAVLFFRPQGLFPARG